MAITPCFLSSFFAFLQAWPILLNIAAAEFSTITTTPPTISCTDVLVFFSPCLSYISSPPNNLSDAATPNCCNAFISAIESGTTVCLCYLLREPQILGFPLNRTRLLSLHTVCTNGSSVSDNGSLNSTCSGSLLGSNTLHSCLLIYLCSATLPPLQSAITPETTSTTPSNTGIGNVASPLAPNSSGDKAGPSPSDKSNGILSGTKQIHSIKSWMLAGIASSLLLVL